MILRKTVASVLLVGALALTPVLTGCAQESGAAENTAVALPEDFPVDVPLADGTIVTAEPFASVGWAATVIVDSADAQQDALDKLTDAGFKNIGTNEDDPKSRTYNYSDGDMSVTVLLSQEGDNFLVDYTMAAIPEK
ncbi:hypothetical protein GCM10022198_06480 [Klugiella xanthotipulae]|uniref:Uncharacterized protein n=1 Tax=Klugiella xanthotipulae TaxID=244735 RepID=A0A543I615_9MICO|nr:hypothetical protein [Klugiella xanthotipulae]TQM66014.1 hypothetical protein FB466_0835 [Klugiella xanthotipulae]